MRKVLGILLLLAAALALYLRSFQETKDLRSRRSEAHGRRMIELHNAYLQRSVGKDAYLKVRAHKAYLVGSSLLQMEGGSVVERVRPNGSGVIVAAEKVEVDLEAMTVLAQPQVRMARLSGGVVIDLGHKRKILTDTAHYDPQEALISSQEPVTLVGEGVHVRGQNLQLFLNDDAFTLGGPVQGSLLQGEL